MVTVVGAGVSGLTTAVVLAEAGYAVEVVSDLPPSSTTSAIAGASWGPYLAEDSRILRWSSRSLREFAAAADRRTGIRMLSGLEAYDDHLPQVPDWARAVPGYRDCERTEIPAGYTGAWQYTIPLIDMPRYLDYLLARLTTAGGRLTIGPRLDSLDLVPSDLIVNCAGLRAADLIGDEELIPVKGQLVVIANPGINEFFQDNVVGAMTCIFPHRDYVVLGGSSITGETGMDWDADEEAAIIRRCAAIDPRIASATVVGRRVGLRPSRTRVRLERDDRDPRVIHNYGHGGSGVTLSWGCATDVLGLVRKTTARATEAA